MRDDRAGRGGPADRLRERLAGPGADEPPLLLPLGDSGARRAGAASARSRGAGCASSRTTAVTSRSATTTSSATGRSSTATARSPTTTSRPRPIEEFCADALPQLEEATVELVESAELDELLVDTVRATFPPHEHERFVAHYRGLLGAWAQRPGEREGRVHALTPVEVAPRPLDNRLLQPRNRRPSWRSPNRSIPSSSRSTIPTASSTG